MKKLSILRDIAIFCWNVVLFMLATAFGIMFSQESYLLGFFYLLCGALSSFWTTRLLFTAVPSMIAFPFVFINFASAVISDDTQGKAKLSLWDKMTLMDGHIMSFIIAVAVAVIGWLLMKFVFRTHESWAMKAKPYVLSVTLGIAVLYFVLLITNW